MFKNKPGMQMSTSQDRILMITLEYGRRIQGGVGRVVNGIFNAKTKQIEMDIFLIKLPTPGRPDLAYVYRQINHPQVDCLYSGLYLEVLKKALNEGNYSVIHLMTGGPLVNNCITTIRDLCPDIQIIYSCHSIAKHEINIRNNRPTDLAQEDFLIQNVDHIHVLNSTSLIYLTTCYPTIDKTSVSIIPNATEASEFSSVDESFKEHILSQVNPQEDILICCMSRWSYGKGLEYLLEAIPKVVKKYSQAKFILAGRKSQSWEYQVGEYVSMIDSKIETLNKHVIVLEWLNNKERNTLFSIVSFCIMPSLLEYFPYSILEPMICKVPIISSNIDSVREMLEEGKECDFYSAHDSNELADCIIHRIENKKQGQEMADNAYRKAIQQYNWESVCKQYDQMYTTVMKKLRIKMRS